MHLAIYAALGAALMVSTSPKAEVRGAWVTAWSPGFRTPRELDATINAAVKAGLNNLFIQVRKVADAYYESKIEPRGNGIAPGFDPLGAAIKEAHAKKIKIHAWINALRVWRAETPPTDSNHVLNRHPEWLNKRADGAVRVDDGQYLDPGIPEVREYVASIAEDITRRYSVDGIHLDYIRYPGPDWGYSDLALRHFAAETGVKGVPKPSNPEWIKWRRTQVTKLVELIRDRVHAVRSRAKVTAATISWMDCPSDYRSSTPYKRVLQDWRGWLAQGLLDANIPMNYRIESNPDSARQFRKWLVGYRKWGAGKPIYVGVGAHNNTVTDVLKQIDAVEKAKMQGWVIFPFNQSAERTVLVKALAARRQKAAWRKK